MDEKTRGRFAGLTSAHVADACLQTGSGFAIAPSGTAPVGQGMRAHGPVRPVRHYGSVDVFLEAIDTAASGEIMVIDNGGRRDEACIGDLVAIEAEAAGLAGIVVWGLHRDTAEMVELGLPVFSLGSTPLGPQRLDPRENNAFTVAQIGDATVGRNDWALADSDGVIFVNQADLDSVLAAAEQIRDVEHRQAGGVRQGHTIRDQLLFAEYKKKAAQDPDYTLRQHLIETGGAIET